jgi:hypothetical protein
MFFCRLTAYEKVDRSLMSNQSLETKTDHILQKINHLQEKLDHVEFAVKGLQNSIHKSRDASSPARAKNQLKNAKANTLWLWRNLIRTPYIVTTALLGILVTYISLRYDVSVTNFTSTNLSDPFSSRFLVSNEGPFSIYDVTYDCMSVHVRSALDGIPMPEIENLTTVPRPLSEIRARSQYSVLCQFPLDTPGVKFEEGALLEIRVSYTPRFEPWARKKGGQMFVLKFDHEGHSVWLPIGTFVESREAMKTLAIP